MSELGRVGILISGRGSNMIALLDAMSEGRIRAELEARGKPIGPLDTMIAAHALSLGLTIVTSNEREFRRVPSLKVENWAK